MRVQNVSMGSIFPLASPRRSHAGPPMRKSANCFDALRRRIPRGVAARYQTSQVPISKLEKKIPDFLKLGRRAIRPLFLKKDQATNLAKPGTALDENRRGGRNVGRPLLPIEKKLGARSTEKSATFLVSAVSNGVEPE